jgi:hypothetical protein
VKLLMIVILFVSSAAHAVNYGIGGILGSPSGISAHMRLDKERNLAAALAYNFSSYRGLHLHVDYLWDNKYKTTLAGQVWGLYYGLGGRLITINSGKNKGHTSFGVRAPGGVFRNFTDPNIMLFGEIVPVLNLSPNTEIHFDAGAGVRILF